MRDQILAIYVVPIVLQIVLPLALILSVAKARGGTRLEAFARILLAIAYLLFLSVVGVWLAVSWYAIPVLAVLLMAAAAWKLRHIAVLPAMPKERRQWIRAGGTLLLVLAAVALLARGVSGWALPLEEVAELDFPFRDGTFAVVAGGSNGFVNFHIATLENPRLSDYRGQSYAIDIVKVDALGHRAARFASRNPRDYRIFGEPVYAPCSGIVVHAEDGLRDMSPPEPDTTRPLGNHVILQCGRHQIVMAHFQQGSVLVRPDDRVQSGDMIARAGNSGRSGEPHLHIHAQRPPLSGAPVSGDPVPMRFGGRFLVRNDWVESEHF